MKITLCGSTAFWDDLLIVKSELEELGHTVKLPPDKVRNEAGEIISIEDYYEIRKNIDDDSSWIWKRKGEVTLNHFERISWSDCIVVVNMKKNNVEGYIGSNTLMDMGVAFYLQKRIFLLNDIPEISSKEEILGMSAVVLDGNLANFV